jgi:hypothetical protein
MTDVLLVAGALIFEPDWDPAGPGFVPDRLARRLRRARRTWTAFEARWSDGAAQLQWLARAFGVPGEPPPSAAYAWRAAGAAAPEGACGEAWFCDPVHLQLQPDRALLSPLDAPPLGEAEARALFDEAADSARGHGAELRQAAGRWYLFPAERWDLQATPLEAALGASVQTRLPQGRHGARWRRLLNEIQMRWHASPVNREREARRQQAVNALWLHGGGAWQALGPSRFGRVEAGDPVVLGWQQAAGAGGAAPPDTLTVWPQLFEPYWRRDWRAWGAAWAQLDAAVESLLDRSRRPLELVACGRRGATSFRLDPSPSFLGWRRSALRECLAEPSG